MSKEEKLLKILEQFRNELSDKELAFIDDLNNEGESIKKNLGFYRFRLQSFY